MLDLAYVLLTLLCFALFLLYVYGMEQIRD
ncbi:hypothetical protein Mgrana_02603 [Meiothermus granaticius NBRC 107808]|uniref:Uncharacterized protein n=1 Tax=Meiothermus granaticius NBRC 107808 TaxID=1227551 RepID=A0A399F5Y0_9DEIN|nr:hypothetical protein Mgrana_02603 [Meiothermus granaticius NBRC 107808]